MWTLVLRVVRRMPAVLLPIAGVFGYIGYHVEGWLSDRYTPGTDPVIQQREERLLENLDSGNIRKKHKPLEINLSPTLS